MSANKAVIVEPYNEGWKNEFIKIRDFLLSVLEGCVLGIEHIGSTSVEGLAAKPIIDIDVVIKDYNSFELVKDRLSKLGYIYEGDLGVKDRHAFKYKEMPGLMKHHLYVCPEYSEQRKINCAFRDYLQTHTEDREWYSEVKKLAAKCYPNDINSYMTAKKPCCIEIINRCGLKGNL